MESVGEQIAATAEAGKLAADTALPKEMDAALGEAFDNIAGDLREKAGIAPRDEQGRKEQPPDADLEGEAEKASTAEPVKGVEKPPDVELEAALRSIRMLPGMPTEVVDKLSREQILAWGSKAKEASDAVSVKLQKQAEDLKRAQEPAKETTAKPEGVVAPTVPADLEAALQAFGEYGDDFKKPLGEFGRAAIKAARDSVMAEIQPQADGLAEMRAVFGELLAETLRRESGERFPGLVEDKGLQDKQSAAFVRLWGEDGASYEHAAPTLLGRIRACFQDSCRLSSDDPKPRKDDSQTKAQRIPAAPARSVPKKTPSVDEEVDSEIDAAMKRWG